MLLLQILGEVMKFYNLGDKSFETDFRKNMFSIKQNGLFQNNNHTGGGCKVFIVLCSLGKLADSPNAPPPWKVLRKENIPLAWNYLFL